MIEAMEQVNGIGTEPSINDIGTITFLCYTIQKQFEID